MKKSPYRRATLVSAMWIMSCGENAIKYKVQQATSTYLTSVKLNLNLMLNFTQTKHLRHSSEPSSPVTCYLNSSTETSKRALSFKRCSPCQCKSRPQTQTGTLRPALRCRWSTPDSSSCVWRRAAECGTPALSCPEIRPTWLLAWWCTASRSYNDILWLRWHV